MLRQGGLSNYSEEEGEGSSSGSSRCEGHGSTNRGGSSSSGSSAGCVGGGGDVSSSEDDSADLFVIGVNSTSGTSLGIGASNHSISDGEVGGISIIDKESSDNVLSAVASLVDSFDVGVSSSSVDGSTRSASRGSVGGEDIGGRC